MKEIKYKIYNLSFRSFLLYWVYLFIFITPIYNYKIPEEFPDETEKQENTRDKSYFDTDIEFFVPKYDFQRPYKFQKKGYHDLYRSLNNSENYMSENLADVFIFSESHLKDTDNYYRNEILDNIIKKEVNIEDVRLSSDNDIYGFPDAKSFDESPKLIKDDDVHIKNYSEMGLNLIFTPNSLAINDK